MQSRILPLALAFLFWALAVGSAVAWGLQWSGRFMNPPRAASSIAASGNEGAVVNPTGVARLLGAVEAPVVASVAPSTASRLSLLGVIASQGTQTEAALIAVDGRPPKPFLRGATVLDGLVLLSVTPRRALLGTGPDAPPSITLDMPARPDSVASSPASPG